MAGQVIKNEAGIYRQGLGASSHLNFFLNKFILNCVHSVQIVATEKEDPSKLCYVFPFLHSFPPPPQLCGNVVIDQYTLTATFVQWTVPLVFELLPFLYNTTCCRLSYQEWSIGQYTTQPQF